LIYVGLDHDKANEFKLDEVTEYAHALFDEPEVYVVLGRHDSHLANLDKALEKVSTYLKTTDVTLCNTSFTKYMSFAKIGVMFFGQKHK